jgi:hypothetical protein
MQERIKELEAKCWDYGRGIVNTQKFAELIVRECANVAMQADIDGCNIGNRAWQKINEHFGVEE